MPANTRILVTGAGGFIGLSVVKALVAQGRDVCAFDLSLSPGLAAEVERHDAVCFMPGDLTEWPQLLAAFQTFKPQQVIHCAAIVGVSNSVASPMTTMRVNVEGSLAVMAAARLFGVDRILNLSTEEVYGPFDAPLINEDHPCRPQQPYGISKRAVECLGRDFSAETGIDFINLRTCWVYGPGLPRPRIPKTLVDAATAGVPFHLSSGSDFRVDHVYIDDLVQGVVLALDCKDHPDDVYHLTTGQAPSLAEIASIMRHLVPGSQYDIGPGNYIFADGTPAIRKGALSPERAAKAFGYAPVFDIAKGLAACVTAARSTEPH